jgi:hypothetical protein
MSRTASSGRFYLGDLWRLCTSAGFRRYGDLSGGVYLLSLGVFWIIVISHPPVVSLDRERAAIGKLAE